MKTCKKKKLSNFYVWGILRIGNANRPLHVQMFLTTFDGKREKQDISGLGQV